MSAKVPTANQRAARARTAEKLKCPACQRKAALSARYELRHEVITTRRIGSARTCRYCGHEVGVRDGQSFGRILPPTEGKAPDGQ